MTKFNFYLQSIFLATALVLVALMVFINFDGFYFAVLQFFCGVYEFPLCCYLLLRNAPAKKLLTIHLVLSILVIGIILQDHRIDADDFMKLGFKQSFLPWTLAGYLWWIFYREIVSRKSIL